MNRRQFFWWMGAAVIAALGFWFGVPPRSPEPPRPPGSRLQVNFEHVIHESVKRDETAEPIRFSAVARQAGISFTYYGNPSPEHFMTEQNGGGIALLDFDGDNQLDVFLANGSDFQHPAEEAGATHKLYQATDTLRYRDISREAGVAESGFGMGCAAGDYDNDGFGDLFLAGYGTNRLWKNNGDGTFSEISRVVGVGQSGWATSPAFADLDSDGNLDLYVVTYVKYSSSDPPCFTQTDRGPLRVLCDPFGQPGEPDHLYHNTGDGRFEDVSENAGVALPGGKGLAVAIADLDEDGRLDVYVANDTTPNFLFRNLGAMRFAEEGVTRGVACGDDGRPLSGMGIGCDDFNRDGRLDLFVTNFENRVNALYENLGAGTFRTCNDQAGLDVVSRPVLGFGTVFADFDLDGWSDLFVANGHIWDLTSLGLGHEYAMYPHLFRNSQGQRFIHSSRQAGDYFQKKWLGRAVAAGDLDNDGDTDLIVSHLGTAVEVLRNDSDRRGNSVKLKFVGINSARQPAGARVEVACGGIRLVRTIPAGHSFQASHDDCLIFGTGLAGIIDEISVHWREGSAEIWRNIPVASPLIRLREGTGEIQFSGSGDG